MRVACNAFSTVTRCKKTGNKPGTTRCAPGGAACCRPAAAFETVWRNVFASAWSSALREDLSFAPLRSSAITGVIGFTITWRHPIIPQEFLLYSRPPTCVLSSTQPCLPPSSGPSPARYVLASPPSSLQADRAPKQTPRSTFARSVRFASTGKQPTLKERLAELIPAELEQVCLGYHITIR